MRRAQQRYTQKLVEMLPADVTRAVDVGCEMGDVARAMAGRGKTVVALSPAKYWFLRTFFRRQFKDYQRTPDCYHKRCDQTLFK